MRAAIALPYWLLVSGLVFAAAPSVNAMTTHKDPQAPCYRWPAVDYDGDGVFDRTDRCNDTPHGCAVDEFGCSIDSDHDGVCDGLDTCPETARGADVDEHGCSKDQHAARATPPAEPPRQVSAPAPPPPPPPPPAPPMGEREREFVETGRIRLENVNFATGSADLLPESEETLHAVGKALEKYPKLRVEVQGHSDTRGAAASNLRLSEARAASVRRWLLDHFDLHPDNLVAKGYGETQPLTDERTEADRLRNRRVEMVALNPEVLPRGVKVENKE